MVLTACSALSPATNSSCHRHRRIDVLPDPVGPTSLRQLDTSNGCQDHTASPYAGNVSRLCAVRSLTGFSTRPAISWRPTLPRPPHPVPTFVTIARNAPRVGRDGEIYRGDLVSEKQKYFCKWDWTGRNHEPSLICPSGKIR